jgi:hypothetical protein
MMVYKYVLVALLALSCMSRPSPGFAESKYIKIANELQAVDCGTKGDDALSRLGKPCGSPSLHLQCDGKGNCCDFSDHDTCHPVTQ